MSKPKKSEILTEAKIMRLREAAPRFTSAVPYQPGDLVTARTDGPQINKGAPVIVLEISADAKPDFASCEIGSSGYGVRPNMRVLDIVDDTIAAFWVEAAHYEPYTGEGK